MRDAAATLAVAGLAALIASRLPLGREWSDSYFLIRDVTNGASPYYNVAYLPLGIALDRVLGVAPARSLEWLSALALGLTLALTHGMLRRTGVDRWTTLALVAAVGLAPGVAFHATVVEVHGVALAGATGALALALAARGAPRARANGLLAASLAVLLLTHLSHVFLVPGIAWLAFARGRSTGAGLGRAGWIATGAAIVAITGAGVWLASAGPETWVAYPWLRPLGTLADFTRGLGAARASAGWFTPVEQLAYLWRELVWPLGLLTLAPLALFLRWRALEATERGLALDLLPLVAVPALVLSQTGVHERGGYFLSGAVVAALWLGLAASRTPRAATVLAWTLPLLVVQGWLGVHDRAALLRDTDDPRTFAAAVAPRLQPDDRVLVDSLAKWFRVSSGHRDRVWDLRREVETTPARARSGVLVRAVSRRLREVGQGCLWVDRGLLAAPPHGPWQAELARLVADERLERLESDASWIRVRLAEPGAAGPRD